MPSGRGLEVNVVVLPDLLLDFREYNLNPSPDQVQPCGKVCAVGGRAARMACVLQHLLGDDDGTFRVHLLTRTGNLGRLLLENEFYRDPSRRTPAFRSSNTSCRATESLAARCVPIPASR